MHVGRGNELFILLSIGREGHTTMKEHLDVGPHLFQMRLTRHLHHAVQHGEHPRGYTTDIGDVFVHRLTGYTFALYFEVAQQSRFLLGYAHQIDQWIDVFYQNSAEITNQRACHIIIR